MMICAQAFLCKVYKRRSRYRHNPSEFSIFLVPFFGLFQRTRSIFKLIAFARLKIIDNINTLLGDDLKASICPKDKLKIAASCFSIYAYPYNVTYKKNIL